MFAIFQATMAYGKYHAWQLKRTNRFTYQFPWFPLELDRLMGANKREHGVTLFQVVTETNSATWFKCHNKNNTRKATHTICHLSDVWKVELISKDNQPELTVVSLTKVTVDVWLGLGRRLLVYDVAFARTELTERRRFSHCACCVLAIMVI